MPAAPAFQHSGQHGVREAHQRINVDGDQVVLSVGVDLLQPAVRPEARIIDQDVDLAAAQCCNQRLDASLAAEVADDEFDVDARSRLLNSLLHLRQTCFVPSGQHQG